MGSKLESQWQHDVLFEERRTPGSCKYYHCKPESEKCQVNRARKTSLCAEFCFQSEWGKARRNAIEETNSEVDAIVPPCQAT
jgi:hypothetical protein